MPAERSPKYVAMPGDPLDPHPRDEDDGERPHDVARHPRDLETRGRILDRTRYHSFAEPPDEAPEEEHRERAGDSPQGLCRNFERRREAVHDPHAQARILERRIQSKQNAIARVACERRSSRMS